MISTELDVTKISKIISSQVEHHTCIECCKYYVAPYTSPCGHSLCQRCWKHRKSCPTCAAPVNKHMLVQNVPLQHLTRHVQKLAEAFEKDFQVNLDEFIIEISGGPEKDPNRHVKDWLTSSENHFSMPPTSSQQSTVEPAACLELSSSNIQIHTKTKKSISPSKVAHIPVPQDDWDKIEQLPDTEEISLKRTEHIVGPMDIEEFNIDNDYSMEKPRRSSRQKPTTSNSSKTKETVEKANSYNSAAEMDKKQQKQNWSNVKRMRREFSKLNKKNRSKLNVSIEMCKKTQGTTNKPNTEITVESQKPDENIDEITPNIANVIDLMEIDELHGNNNHKIPCSKEYGENKENDNNGNVINKDDAISDDLPAVQINNDITESNNEICLNNRTNDDKVLKNQISIKSASSVASEKTNSKKAVPFIVKSALQRESPVPTKVKTPQKLPEIVTHTKVLNKPVNANPTNHHVESADDIEITIKIGNTLTNIFIKKKTNDVSYKVNTDREVQTSIGNQDIQCQTNKVSVRNIEIGVGEGDCEVTKVTQTLANASKKTILANTISTAKKNTASADTSTAHFEITDSVEKELSKIMECQSNENNTQKQDAPLSLQKTTQILQKTIQTQDEIEYANDIDIFGSGTDKEQNVQPLKSTAKTPSEILMPTMRTNRTRSQKQPEKRNLDEELREESCSKRLKTITEDIQREPNEVSMTDDVEIVPDSEPINYDAVMDKVFANIDADIEEIQKSQRKNTQKLTQTQHKNIQLQTTQILQQSFGKSKDVTSEINQKYSENVFSILEKDSQHHDAMDTDEQVPGTETQHHIENLLTPGICDEMAFTKNNDAIDDVIEVPELATPHDADDSDKSVVEETPQKNVSFSKPNRSRSDITLKPATTIPKICVQQTSPKTTEVRSIINLTDTTVESCKSNKDVTVVEKMRNRPTMETPLTINRFVHNIQHNSTPVARKSLNFNQDLDDQTLCPTDVHNIETTQEREIMSKAFEQTPQSQQRKPLAMRNVSNSQMMRRKFCVAGSCLTSYELTNLKLLCARRQWTYVDKYTEDLTHLVVGVDENNRSQRSVKYMCALAAGKWIVSYTWVERCLATKTVHNEEVYEVLDSTGAAGPRGARLAARKLFTGIIFHCMPPFNILDETTLKVMLSAAGGRVVEAPLSARDCAGPALLVAEPEHTQEDRFIYMAVELGVVPINMEWVLNCLGSYTLGSIYELLLCPATLLPPSVQRWPPEMIALDDDDD